MEMRIKRECDNCNHAGMPRANRPQWPQIKGSNRPAKRGEPSSTVLCRLLAFSILRSSDSASKPPLRRHPRSVRDQVLFGRHRFDGRVEPRSDSKCNIGGFTGPSIPVRRMKSAQTDHRLKRAAKSVVDQCSILPDQWRQIRYGAHGNQSRKSFRSTWGSLALFESHDNFKDESNGTEIVKARPRFRIDGA